MTQTMKIPIILWGDRPPSHQVTCMTVCNNGSIATGSIEGQLIFWTIDFRGSATYVRPQNMIIAHSSSVEALVSIHNRKLNIHSGVISLDNNQELCLWNSETCCCLATTSLRGRFHSLTLLPCRNPKAIRECLLACYGYRDVMYLLDPFTFQIIFILKQKAFRKSIRTVRSVSAGFVADRDEDIVLALTHDGFLSGYKLPTNIGSTKDDKSIKIQGTCVEVDKSISPKAIHSILVEPIDSQYFLIWCLNEIFIVNFKDVHLVNKLCTDTFTIRNIIFVDKFSIVVYFDNHSPVFYHFDPQYNLSQQITLVIPEGPRSGLVSAAVIKPDLSSNQTTLFGMTRTGHLLSWNLTSLNSLDPPLTLECSGDVTLSQIWGENDPTGVAAHLPELHFLNSKVSCSLQLSDYGFMIFGLANGSIIIVNSVELLRYQLLRCEESKRFSKIVLEGHVGAVTCLCHPFDDSNRYDPCQLISGGSDFSIRLWDIVAGVQLKAFYPHGGFIQEIFVMAAEKMSTSNLTIISVASDYSVALINLSYERAVLRTRCHTSPVFSVKWRISEDILLVYCIDGSLFVWQITTGNLERCVTGKIAAEIFDGDDGEVKEVKDLEENSYQGIVSIDSSITEKRSQSIFHHLKVKRGFMSSHKHTAHLLPTKKKFKRVLKKISIKHRQHWNLSINKDFQEYIRELSTQSPDNSLGLTNLVSHPTHHSSACNIATNHPGPSHSFKDAASSTSSVCAAFTPFLDVISIRTGHHDPDFHIFCIDFDIVISFLIAEEDKLLAHNTNKAFSHYESGASLFSEPGPEIKVTSYPTPHFNVDKLALNVLKMGLTITDDIQAYKRYCQYLQEYRTHVIFSTSKMLLACLHPWGLDAKLDNFCLNELELVAPLKPVSFGFMSRHKLQLNIPGWRPSLQKVQETLKPLVPASPPVFELEKYISQWQISSIITAQHLVSLVSITYSFMNIYNPDKQNRFSVEDLDITKDFHEGVKEISSASGRVFITQSVPDLIQDKLAQKHEKLWKRWNFLFEGYCSIVSSMIKNKIYHQIPCIHELICYWMDSFDEISYSSYCMLMIELNHMTTSTRKSLVRSWCLYLPTPEQVENLETQDLLIFPTDDFMETGGFYGFWPSDRRYQRTIAVFLVSFMISEFPTEFDPLTVSEQGAQVIVSVPTIILLANIMSKLLKSMINVKEYSQYPMRKAFIFFLGRAFNVWRPHINLCQALMSVLETNAYVDFYLQYLTSINRHKSHQYQQLSELLHKYRDALKEIMSKHSDVVVTVINKEFPRYSSLNAHISMGQSSLVAAVACSNVRYQQNPLTSQPSRVQLVRTEIVYLIDMMAKRCPDNFVKLIIEVVDLLLSCSVHRIVKKETDFMLFFPFLKKFPMIDYCMHTRRLVVGKINGQFGVYELRNLRCTLVNNYTKPITCLKFCPDGRHMVTYCHEEQKLCVWNTHVSILGLISNTPKPGMNYTLRQTPNISPKDLRKIHIVWNNSNSFRLIFNETNELSFTA